MNLQNIARKVYEESMTEYLSFLSGTELREISKLRGSNFAELQRLSY